MRVAVPSSAADLLVTADVHGQAVTICNRGDAAVYVEKTAALASATDGYELGPDESLGGYLEQGESLYALAASGTQSVHVLAFGSD